MAKKLAANAREQQVILLVGCLGVLILYLYAVFIIGPIRRESRELARDSQNAQEKLRGLETVVANEATVRQQYEQADQAVRGLRSHLPAESELSQLIQLLTDWADRSQVKIQTISPQRPEAVQETGVDQPASDKPVVYEDIFIQIDALAGYHQLGVFLNLIEGSDKPLHLSTLKISGNAREPKRSNIKLLLGTYLSKGAGQPPAVRGAGPS